MTSFSSTLSSRGWAFLILAGGCALSIPFFRGATSTEPHYSSANKNATAASEFDIDTVSPVVTTRQSDGNTPLVSSSQDFDKRSTPSAQSPWRTTLEVAGITELKVPLAKNQSRPMGMSSSGKTTEVVESLKQSVNLGLSEAAPIQAELPAWAKKPSLLDTLVTSKSTLNKAVETAEHIPPLAKKPTPFQAWTPQDKTNSVETSDVSPSDRSSPFRDSDGPYEPAHTRSTIRWPDEDPRTAVAQPIFERVVGRDAMIRDPEVQSLADRQGRTVVHPSTSSTITPPRFSPTNRIVQPRFGQALDNSSHGAKVQVGTALRSLVPPDEHLYIRQPRL